MSHVMPKAFEEYLMFSSTKGLKIQRCSLCLPALGSATSSAFLSSVCEVRISGLQQIV
jgi:hypothetical protein